MSAGTVVEALQDALAGEHAAVYAYGVIGGRLDYGTRYQDLATGLYADHRDRRDALTQYVADAGAEPVAAEAAYELPVAVESDTDAQRLGQQLEDRCSVLYAGVVATATGGPRSFAVEALGGSALAGVEWGAPSTALPGVEQP
ncbi:ferritin-like domain-containing protein [Solicola gregarius]|uniref:Ferritin-like domain-containing protein n=1 Tax=Solicola gregarius TaxID=2908642 RepID=A0AA46TFN8_9ACTN|nr:ferritin-like domain-containing protein [Solicola gregarius]UYM04477.1 ferritin-like domain-containing protein [Solicola gregarius]